jgi:hypothetical protein
MEPDAYTPCHFIRCFKTFSECYLSTLSLTTKAAFVKRSSLCDIWPSELLGYANVIKHVDTASASLYLRGLRHKFACNSLDWEGRTDIYAFPVIYKSERPEDSISCHNRYCTYITHVARYCWLFYLHQRKNINCMFVWIFYDAVLTAEISRSYTLQFA